ncbi:hypothetical protein L6452_10456 [Arctium lappa]|uniref:Uncharacterized protein n=1 Tax=Arctium lappa TaxID=4217 RepID=A0ACB9DN84_ARCLA|nr:hypothetical protein L6452_10456 [Arctium lappa]
MWKRVAPIVEESKKENQLDLDVVTETELRENGFLGMRKTKLVCTVEPSCCSYEELEKLALGRMSLARLNMLILDIGIKI